MRVTSRCHIKALSENLELGLIGGVLASAVDSFWVVCDIYHNGMSTHYMIILTTLLLSTLILTIATVRHHRSNVKQQLGLLYVFKKNVCRAKNRKARHSLKLPIRGK
jgi:hypothetical protein